MGLASARIFGAQVPDIFLPLAWPTQIRAPLSAANGGPGKFLLGMRWFVIHA